MMQHFSGFLEFSIVINTHPIGEMVEVVFDEK